MNWCPVHIDLQEGFERDTAGEIPLMTNRLTGQARRARQKLTVIRIQAKRLKYEEYRQFTSTADGSSELKNS